jgi:hypothetical protein
MLVTAARNTNYTRPAKRQPDGLQTTSFKSYISNTKSFVQGICNTEITVFSHAVALLVEMFWFESTWWQVEPHTWRKFRVRYWNIIFNESNAIQHSGKHVYHLLYYYASQKNALCPHIIWHTASLSDFHEISYLGFFRKSVRKIQVWLQSDKNNGAIYIKTFRHLTISR